jgi:hypothetical protein
VVDQVLLDATAAADQVQQGSSPRTLHIHRQRTVA